jgi:hypothetical protein
MYFKYKKFSPIDALILCFALYTSFATSFVKKEGSILPGTYKITSDCPQAKNSGNVTVSGNTLEAQQAQNSKPVMPNRITGALEYGLPSELFTPDGPDRVMIRGPDRYCKAIQLEEFLIFTCFKSSTNDLECTVTLEPS